MFDDVRSAEKDPARPVPSQFAPFSSTEMTSALTNYAKKYLNETEEVKRKGLQEMREFINRDLNVFTTLDDVTLLCFLRSRRFDVKEACSVLKKAADFLETHQSQFNQLDEDVVQRTIESKVLGFLPYRDSKSRGIIYVRTECWDPSELNIGDLIFSAIIAMHVLAENEVNQVAGFVVVMDCQNLSFWQFRAVSSWLLFAVQTIQNCAPLTVKEVHVLHTPTLVLFCWNIIQPLIKDNYKKRITFYSSSDWEKLHDKIPPCILPEELGGQLEPNSHEHWASDIPLMMKKFFKKCNQALGRHITG